MKHENQPAVEAVATATQTNLERENRALRAQLASTQDALGVTPADLEAEVSRRMTMGLSREDALVCARRQIRQDRIIGGIEAEAAAAARQAKEDLKKEARENQDPTPARAELLGAAAQATMQVYNAHRAELVAAGV